MRHNLKGLKISRQVVKTIATMQLPNFEQHIVMLQVCCSYSLIVFNILSQHLFIFKRFHSEHLYLVNILYASSYF